MVIAYRRNRLESLCVWRRAVLLVMEKPKPGNLGRSCASADAAGVDAVLVPTPPDQGTDLHNPNVIRASLGPRFTVPTVAATTGETIGWLHEQGDHCRRRRPGGRDVSYGRRPDQAGGFGRGQRGVGIERYVAGGGRRAVCASHGWSSGQFESVGLGGAADVRGGAAARSIGQTGVFAFSRLRNTRDSQRFVAPATGRQRGLNNCDGSGSLCRDQATRLPVTFSYSSIRDAFRNEHFVSIISGSTTLLHLPPSPETSDNRCVAHRDQPAPEAKRADHL